MTQINYTPTLALLEQQQNRDRAATWLDGQSPIDMFDAANECPHGKLPHDPVQHCACWTPPS